MLAFRVFTLIGLSMLLFANMFRGRQVDVNARAVHKNTAQTSWWSKNRVFSMLDGVGQP